MSKKKILIASDSFKGTLSSCEICSIAKSLYKENFKDDIYLDTIAIADGGEGTLDAILSLDGAKKIYCEVNSAHSKKVKCFYVSYLDKAYIEMAQCAGIQFKDDGSILYASTYGVGEIILSAIKHGFKEIVLTLGGSCTNDGGAGMLKALGCTFLNEKNEEIFPYPYLLSTIKNINTDKINILDVKFTCLCDVTNKAYGTNGATYVFAKQKGATPNDLIILENNIKYYCDFLSNYRNIDLQNIKGSGAAGAFPLSTISLLNSSMQSGFANLSNILDLENKIKNSDIVISGEGSLDSQSLQGKVLSSIAKLTTKYNKKLIALVGTIDDSNLDLYYKENINAIFSINRQALDFSISKDNAYINYKNSLRDILKLCCF